MEYFPDAIGLHLENPGREMWLVLKGTSSVAAFAESLTAPVDIKILDESRYHKLLVAGCASRLRFVSGVE